MKEFLDVKIDDYEGPLDLLVHLVYRNEMDIFNVSISEITSGFISEIRAMHDMDIEVAGEFINMASYLVYLKSRMLLPIDGISDEDIDPEEAKFRFNQMLIEYSFYKEMSLEFRKREKAAGMYLSRSQSLVLLKEDIFTEDSFRLAAAFFSINSDKKEKHMLVKNSKIATEELAKKIRSFILSREKTLWSEISAQCHEKIESCVSFGAVLELVKSKKVSSYQEENFSEILLTLIK